MLNSPGTDGHPSLPVVEFQPTEHPDVLFRAHSARGRYRVMHLGGEEYWMQGIWTAQRQGRIIFVKDRLFRVSELLTAAPEMSLPNKADFLRPFVS